MSKLATHLIAVPQRESSGEDTAARYHYQALIGLTLILQSHGQNNDYAIVFEFHDDIALLDSSSKPETISFFQVKTKDKGHWNLSKLLQQKAGAKTKGQPEKLPSILGKMYHNVINFQDYLGCASFVSNAHIEFGPDEVDFFLKDCTPEEIGRVKAQIQKEHKGAEHVNTSAIRFSRNHLSLADSDTHAKGMLNKFVVENLGEVAFSLNALFRTVVDECSRKSRSKVENNSLAEIIEKKAITKAKVNEWLSSVKRTVDCPEWAEIANEINYAHLTKVRMGREWQTYRAQVLDTNAAVNSIRGEIRRELNKEKYASLSLIEAIESAFLMVESFARTRASDLSTERLKVMIIYETYARDQT